MDVDPNIIAYAATLILAVLSALLGKKWSVAKDKFADSEKLALKMAAALKATSEAIEDNAITPKEEKIIVSRWSDLIDEAKDLLK